MTQDFDESIIDDPDPSGLAVEPGTSPDRIDATLDLMTDATGHQSDGLVGCRPSVGGPLPSKDEDGRVGA